MSGGGFVAGRTCNGCGVDLDYQVVFHPEGDVYLCRGCAEQAVPGFVVMCDRAMGECGSGDGVVNRSLCVSDGAI